MCVLATKLKVRNHFAQGFYGSDCGIQPKIRDFLFKHPKPSGLQALRACASVHSGPDYSEDCGELQTLLYRERGSAGEATSVTWTSSYTCPLAVYKVFPLIGVACWD